MLDLFEATLIARPPLLRLVVVVALGQHTDRGIEADVQAFRIQVDSATSAVLLNFGGFWRILGWLRVLGYLLLLGRYL